ncbi:pectinesterase [Roseimarinus sediminis]|uniref:hypothetical protein n=1 Tax=Roseimarinus sediminis TaxID=1610899 RepID=UPI003D249E0B
MKKIHRPYLLFVLGIILFADPLAAQYQSLDPSCPIEFHGTYLLYRQQKIELGPRAFFIDGQMSREEAGKHRWVFSSVNEAVAHLSDGTEDEPMVLYLAPWVYWIDDPDDQAVRRGKNGRPPYALEISCDWLRFYGLSNDPSKVVLAVNRGQTIGAEGNFTMFRFDGDGTSAENITFGNYCNIDLDYPLKPELGREKRAAAIVQAQLIHCNGDKIVARNTRFVSRLNLCPFVGARRALFDRCHFESTDDALCGTGVYLNCTLDFYSSKPFYYTRGTGAVFLNCDIDVYNGGRQYFTKANGQLAVIDSRFVSESSNYIGWQDHPPLETRNYQFGNTLNGQALFIGKEDTVSTVDLQTLPLLAAYRLEHADTVLYNVYNLLRGNDDWDPTHTARLIKSLEISERHNYSMLPVQLRVSPTQVKIETGKDSLLLNASLFRFGNVPFHDEKINWRLAAGAKHLLTLHPSADGAACILIPHNDSNEAQQVMVEAFTESGLEAAAVITVLPSELPSPDFVVQPVIHAKGNGELVVDYRTDTALPDQSFVSWFRCTDASGKDAIEVAVSRNDQPGKNYRLTASDVGYHVMAVVSPKNARSKPGKAFRTITAVPVDASMVTTDRASLKTDFRQLSVNNQPEIIPGFWTFRHFDDSGTEARQAVPMTGNAWHYGEGRDGAHGMSGLLQSGRSATLLYTPLPGQRGNMKLNLELAPYKTAGQGFSVAHLYMDVLIAFDTKSMSGYALRLIRTTKYGNAVDAYFVEYKNNIATPVGKAVTTSAFRTPCTIELIAKGKQLSARLSTEGNYTDPAFPELLPQLAISVDVDSVFHGGFGINYNGGVQTMIRQIEARWEP